MVDDDVFRGGLSSTATGHVYKMVDGFYHDEFDEKIYRGNYIIFDEHGLALDSYMTYDEAVSAITAYCRSLGSPD